MRIAILLTLVLLRCIAGADDLDVIVDRKASAEDRGQAYGRLTSADFPAIAIKLATLIGAQRPSESGFGPRTEQPWSEAKLGADAQILFTLGKLWSHHTKAAEKRGENLDLMLAVIEDKSVGVGRHRAIAEISVRLHWAKYPPHPAIPDLDQVLARLDRFAFDPENPNDLRRRGVAILFEHGDPNKYLDLANELSAGEDTPLRQAEAFRFCTPSYQPGKLTAANRKKYLRHCYGLLEKIDDGRSGKGYHFAIHIGHFLGLPPVHGGDGPFKPDQKLPQYQKSTGLHESFFQDTVNNARKWWDQHKAEY